MKKVVDLLIGLSVVTTILAVISKLSGQAILGMGPRAIVPLTAILLLLAIALSVKK